MTFEELKEELELDFKNSINPNDVQIETGSLDDYTIKLRTSIFNDILNILERYHKEVD